MQTERVVTTIEEELARTGRLVYTNVGVSMMPLLRQGRDLMVIERCDPAELHRYDAVLFRRRSEQGGAYVLHRIIKCLPDGAYWIVGDNCITGERVEADQILGVLTSVLRGKKTVKMTDFGYRLYVRFWCAPYRMRFLILRFKRFCSRIVSGVCRRVKRLCGRRRAT